MSEKKRKKKKTNRAASAVLPPPGGMEAILSEIAGGAQVTPVDAAQNVIYRAWEESNPSRRIALARQALLISPDCADAYNLLASEGARSLKEASEFYRKGMQAGERAIGEEKFAEFAGHFWGVLDTRPYMRARAGLARCLWEAGKREEAVEHYREMLHLNPNDNQGIRYVLMACLLDLDRNDEVLSLLKQYKDDASAEMVYSAALVAFRKEGDTPRSRKLLAGAIKYNRFVAAYLLGRKKIPRNLPDYIGFGDESEAVSYAGDNVSTWKSTPGAIEWLRLRLSRKSEMRK